MNHPALPLLLASAAAALLSACASPPISQREIRHSDPRATALLAASQQASGRLAFEKIRDVSVRYQGRWAPIGPLFQPVLVDRKFRGGSEERLLIAPRLIAQEHTARGGKKFVLREPGAITVSYNGALSTDSAAQHAAALVADAYTMFLLGPCYFERPGVLLASEGEAIVDRVRCAQVLAVLRPGLGLAAEDRVVLSIDLATKQLRRVRMTLNGLTSTRGAEVDVTFRNFRTIGGLTWPTDFDERIRLPFDLHAHHWRIVGLDFNRGLQAADFAGLKFSARAATPARPLAAPR